MDLSKYTPSSLLEAFKEVRRRSVDICSPLELEDYSIQPVAFVSPPKWHLAHTTWFYEAFLLEDRTNYRSFNERYSFLFNSYYDTLGDRVAREKRGTLTRPTVSDILQYREHVNNAMLEMISKGLSKEQIFVLEIGLNHEEQHQELLVYDLKYILGHQPLLPEYGTGYSVSPAVNPKQRISVDGGLHSIGYNGGGFHFDNEEKLHSVYFENFEIDSDLVTNGEFLEFIMDGGYSTPTLFHSDGWEVINQEGWKHPEYWREQNGRWYEYDLNGLHLLEHNAPVKHISFYEAWAFAQWKGRRLPTEAEWEVASSRSEFAFGKLWEWTESSYLPYPGYKKTKGAIGEYNGKFMVNQKVLRGGSIASSPNHVRPTYRNFFHPNLRWMFSGIRLANDL